MGGEQQREHFRIDYPLANRAKLIIAKKKYDVVDVSQRGLKFELPDDTAAKLFLLGNAVTGVIELLIGKKLNFSGEIIRVYDRTVIVYMREELPLGLMNEEHRYIIKTFQVS